MKLLWLTGLLSILSFCNVYSQNDIKPLIESKLNSEKLFAKGQNIFLQGKKVKPRKIREIYADNPMALSQYKAARTVNGINFFVSMAGGACVGWELGRYVSTGEVNGTTLLVGGGLIGVAIVLQVITNNKIAKSVDIYNGKGKTTTSIEYGILGSGVGVCVKF